MQIELKSVSAAVVCRWLALVLCAVLLVLLLFTAMRSPDPPPRLALSSTGTLQALNWRWFDSRGPARSTGLGTTEIRETLTEASINGTLHGVVITNNRAYATLRMAGREERVYQVGDEIQSATEIIAIEPGRVIVSQNGRERQVTLPRQDAYLSSPRGSAARQPAGVATGVSTNSLQVAGFAASQVAVEGYEGYEGGLQLDAIPEEIDNLGALQRGDVIIDVDGADIQTLLSDPTRWAQYSNNTALPVTVLRNGERLILSVDAHSLAARLMPALSGRRQFQGN